MTGDGLDNCNGQYKDQEFIPHRHILSKLQYQDQTTTMERVKRCGTDKIIGRSLPYAAKQTTWHLLVSTLMILCKKVVSSSASG
eukprot:2394756-Amphidinium_carterae.1